MSGFNINNVLVLVGEGDSHPLSIPRNKQEWEAILLQGVNNKTNKGVHLKRRTKVKPDLRKRKIKGHLEIKPITIQQDGLSLLCTI